jgi:hypothetical protein
MSNFRMIPLRFALCQYNTVDMCNSTNVAHIHSYPNIYVIIQFGNTQKYAEYNAFFIIYCGIRRPSLSDNILSADNSRTPSLVPDSGVLIISTFGSPRWVIGAGSDEIFVIYMLERSVSLFYFAILFSFDSWSYDIRTDCSSISSFWNVIQT